MAEEGFNKTLVVSIAVCLVCSLVVSSAAVLLAPRQAANREHDRKERMAGIIAQVPGIEALVESARAADLETHVVHLETGEYAQEIDPATYDQRKAAEDPEWSVAVPRERDVAGIRRVPHYAIVYLLRDDAAAIQLVILPVSGEGFASTIYGYVALGADLNTIRGMTFYEHEETPGLGAQIESPEWLAKWQGKQVRDASGRLRVHVAEGTVEPGSPAADYAVDAISGATWTSQGVSNLVRFWLGEDGFGPYLARLARTEERDRT